VQIVRIEKVAMPDYKPWEAKHILVPTLGGPNTETVQVACRIARESGAGVTALYVIEIPEALPIETFLADRLNSGDAALERAEAIGREIGIPVQPKLLQSRNAAGTIAEVARERGCDLIVLGALRGKLSTTVDAVLRKAPCRVWVCTSEQKP
jgi:nucleotide-binding universal stress UspA family protein